MEIAFGSWQGELEAELPRKFPDLWRAREGSYDLIVLGTHGRTGISHMLLGSVAEKVVRGAHCPVLIVRAPDAK